MTNVLRELQQAYIDFNTNDKIRGRTTGDWVESAISGLNHKDPWFGQDEWIVKHFTGTRKQLIRAAVMLLKAAEQMDKVEGSCKPTGPI